MWHDAKLLNGVTNAVLGMLALGLMASALWWFAQRPMFALKAIRIEPAAETQLRHVSVATIRTAAVPRVKGNFFSANLESVREAFETVPWVRKASVRREWPNQLIVTIEEHRPLGIWGDQGKLVSVLGDVFVANLAEAEEDGELAVFGGPEGSAVEVVARYRELHDWLGPAGLAPDSLTLSERYAWTLRLTNGVKVELGREQSKSTIRDRVERLVGIYPQLVARLQDRLESVDMRYPNGLALKAQGLTFGPDKKK
jgi:cell division protein FtsQ